jgi:polyribonucleotide nucleotidyltransferase
MSIVEAELKLEPTTVSVDVGGKTMTFETGKLAKQADGAVVVRSGETMVLATAQGRTEPREGADFFPLTVDVEERMYAAGKIPGGFFKREGRPTERAILTARMIDRPVRPLWPKGYRNETQCIATVLSADMVTSHDILAINGISAALVISPMPFLGPIGAVRMGIVEGELVVNPTLQEAEESELDLIVVGTKDGLTMVEAGADQVPEAKLLEALDVAHREIVRICEAQEELRAKAGKPKWLDGSLTERLESQYGHEVWQRIQEHGIREGGAIVEEIVEKECGPLSMNSTHDDVQRELQTRMSLAMILEKQRQAAVEGPVREQFENDLRALTEAEQDSKELKSAKRHLLFDRIVDTVDLPFPVGPATVDGEPVVKDALTKSYVKKASEAIYKDLVRKKIAIEKRRPDGRSEEEIRPIVCEVSVSPRTHGSGLFTRGQTQIMSLLTLGTAKEGQRIDDLSLETDRRFMHHYNFPPYSVGETGMMRGPKRRDIGHGALAQRALEAVIPPAEEFPYTIRLVSETLESNGSSSMGSVCGSTLALMDAGVPIKAPVSGIAMGLVKEGDDYVILTDIQGAEDHLGDMDFKVAGTSEGITALQMDIKITGVSREIMENALAQAARGARRDPRADAAGDPGAASGARRPRAADPDRADQPGVHRDGHRQGRRDDPLARGRVRGADRHRGGRHDPRLRHRGHEGRRRDRGDHRPHEGARGRRHVHGQGRQDDRLRRVRRAEEGHRRPAARLERRPRPREPHRGRDPRGDILDVLVQEVDKARGRIGLKLVQKHEDGALVSRGARRAGEGRPAARAPRGASARRPRPSRRPRRPGWRRRPARARGSRSDG